MKVKDLEARRGVTVLVYFKVLPMFLPGTTVENLSRKWMSRPRFEPGTSQNVTVGVTLLGFSFRAFGAQNSEGRSASLKRFRVFPLSFPHKCWDGVLGPGLVAAVHSASSKKSQNYHSTQRDVWVIT